MRFLGLTGGIIRLLAGLLSLSASALWLEMVLRAYKTPTKEELAAIVRCIEDPPGSRTLKLILLKYKLTRLRGRYESVGDEVSREQTAYQLREDPLWRWLYRKGERFPFAEAVYGSSAFGVYVAMSGDDQAAGECALRGSVGSPS